MILTPADGSIGIRGFVTNGMAEAGEYTYLYTCGPEPMLKALDKALAEGLEGEMSFEERMGCGFGACMGCSCETRYGNWIVWSYYFEQDGSFCSKIIGHGSSGYGWKRGAQPGSN